MGIRFMPIKGAYLIASGLAEKMPTRHMADIDILVEKENFGAVTQYFSRLDNVRMKHDEWYFEQPFYYRFAGQEYLVEINYLLNRPERFRLPTEELFERGIQKSEVMWWPSIEDALLICICHELVHIAYQPLRAELGSEIAALRELPDFDSEEFLERCRGTGVIRFFGFLQRTSCRPGETSYTEHLGCLLAGLYTRWGSARSSTIRRLLFELPYVRHPVRLLAVSGFLRCPTR